VSGSSSPSDDGAGGLVVSGGGTVAVAVDELFIAAAALGAVAPVVDGWLARAGVLRRGLDLLDVDDPIAVVDAASPAWHAGVGCVRLEQSRDLALAMRSSLLESAERYGLTEGLVEGLWELGAAVAAPWLGLQAPVLVVGALLAAGGQWAGSEIWRALGWGPTPLAAWLDEHRELLSDPGFVRLVRLTADHADEAFSAALHLPVPGGLGAVIRAPESASIVLAAAGLLGAVGSRVLVDGPVRVTRVEPSARESDAVRYGADAAPAGHPAEAPRRLRDVVAPPAGVGDLADRVPSGEDAPQIRIERYGTTDDPRWIVYVGGTADFGLVAGAETADMTSNTHGVADDAKLDRLRFTGADSAAGERAVRAALDEAGARPGEPLLAVGYSGGGIIAAKLAADPELGAVGALSLGGPVASAPTREGVALLSIEHEEDLVPAAGGAGHPSPERVTVTRSVLDPDREYAASVPAHELGRYRRTAALVDGSAEERLVEFRALVDEFTEGGAGLRSDWLAIREVSPATGAR
jgi:hypothetical protein